jgi:hypothetical protein
MRKYECEVSSTDIMFIQSIMKIRPLVQHSSVTIARTHSCAWYRKLVLYKYLQTGLKQNFSYRFPYGYRKRKTRNKAQFCVMYNCLFLNCKFILKYMGFSICFIRQRTLYYTILHHITPYYTILHYITPYYTILHYITLYYTILHKLVWREWECRRSTQKENCV